MTDDEALVLKELFWSGGSARRPFAAGHRFLVQHEQASA